MKMETFTSGPKGPKVLVVDKIEVSDMIRAAAALDPLRKIPEAKALLDMTYEQYETYMADLEEKAKED
jgi:hypothetical protein